MQVSLLRRQIFNKKRSVFYYGDLGKKKEVTNNPCSSAAVRKELIEEKLKEKEKELKQINSITYELKKS